MKTLKMVLDKAHDDGRIAQDLKKKELLDVLEIIAQNIMDGKTTLLDANTLLAIRHGFMNGAERMLDYAKNEAELSMIAASLGKKGGEIITEAKQRAARENGQKGGRPKGSGEKKEE